MDALPQPASETAAPGLQSPRALLVVLSGPSGVGKDSIIDGLAASGMSFHRAVTAVTRSPRPGETHGAHHYFLTPDEFARWEAQGKFLETATVYGRSYGTPLHEVTSALERGEDVLLRVDVQGAASIRERMPASVHVFIGPPSKEALRERRDRRGTEQPVDEATRDALAEREMAAIPRFDYLVVNQPGKLDAAIEQVRAIITAEKCRTSPRG